MSEIDDDHDREPRPNGAAEDAEPRVRVEDRRHWARADREPDDDDASSSPPSTQPTIVDEYRRRAEEAEARLQEYIGAFKQAREEHDQARLRLERDVERKVELRFGSLVADLVSVVDELDLALAHAGDDGTAASLAEGVALTRDRFVATLARHGVERIELDGEPFDPNVAEAHRLDPVADPGLDGKVTATDRPGYRLGDRVIRPARVAVGKLVR